MFRRRALCCWTSVQLAWSWTRGIPQDTLPWPCPTLSAVCRHLHFYAQFYLSYISHCDCQHIYHVGGRWWLLMLRLGSPETLSGISRSFSQLLQLPSPGRGKLLVSTSGSLYSSSCPSSVVQKWEQCSLRILALCGCGRVAWPLWGIELRYSQEPMAKNIPTLLMMEMGIAFWSFFPGLYFWTAQILSVEWMQTARLCQGMGLGIHSLKRSHTILHGIVDCVCSQLLPWIRCRWWCVCVLCSLMKFLRKR